MDSKKKICIIQYNLGATSETFLTRHIELIKPHFKVHCITGSIQDNTILASRKIHDYTKQGKFECILNRIKVRIGFSKYLYSKNILKTIRKIQPDLIVFQFAFIPALLSNSLKHIEQPYIVIHHGTDLNRAIEDRAYYNSLKKVWKYSSHVVTISNFLYKKAIKLGCPSDKCSEIPLGVPLLKNSNKPTPATIKKNTFSILSIGRLEKVKNHSFLINAYINFVKRHPNTQLTIIGSGSEKNNLKNIINKYNLANNIHLTGKLDFNNVIKYIYESDVLCLLSKRVNENGIVQEEGLGLTLLEGAIYKKPLIGTKSGGIPEIVINQETGLLIEVDDIVGLVDSLNYLINNPNECERLGNNAYNHAVNNFDQDKQILHYKELYNLIINTKV